MEQSVKEAFLAYQSAADEEQQLRENIRVTTKELEKHMKGMVGVLQGIHQDVGEANVRKITTECRGILANDIKPLLSELGTKVPMGDFYRFHDIWRFITTKLCFSCVLIWFLESDDVPVRQEVADMLGLTLGTKTVSFYLDTEDYLQGLLQMASELSRFCVNSVAQGDVQRPHKIFKVLTDLQMGFGELNLKNDHLRRMFDGLKYDVKRVEQVIYDITIRGLKSKSLNTEEIAAPTEAAP